MEKERSQKKLTRVEEFSQNIRYQNIESTGILEKVLENCC